MAFNPSDILSQQGYGIPLLHDLHQQTPAGFVTPQLLESGGFPIATGLPEQSLSDILGQPKPAPHEVLTAPVAGVKRMAGGGNVQQGVGAMAAGMMVPPTGTEGGGDFSDMPIGQRILFSLAPSGVQQAILKKREMQRKTAAAQVRAEVEGGLNEFLIKGDTTGATKFVDDTVRQQQFMPELLQDIPRWYKAIQDKYYRVQSSRSLYLGLAGRVINPLTNQEGQTPQFNPNVPQNWRDLYTDWTAKINSGDEASIGEMFDQWGPEAQAQLLSLIYDPKFTPVEAAGGVVSLNAVQGPGGTIPFEYQERTSMYQNEVIQDFLQRRNITPSEFVNGLNNRDPKMIGLLDDMAAHNADYRGIVSQWNNYGPYIEEATGLTLNDLMSMNPNVAGKIVNQFAPGGKYNQQGELQPQQTQQTQQRPGRIMNQALKGSAAQQRDIAEQQEIGRNDSTRKRAIENAMPFIDKAYDLATRMTAQGATARFLENMQGMGIKGWLQLPANWVQAYRELFNVAPTKEERAFVHNMVNILQSLDVLFPGDQQMAATIRSRLDITRSGFSADVADELYLLKDQLDTSLQSINRRIGHAPSRTDQPGSSSPSSVSPVQQGGALRNLPGTTTPPNTPGAPTVPRKPQSGTNPSQSTPTTPSSPLPPVRPGHTITPPAGQGFVPTNPKAEKEFRRKQIEQELKRRGQQIIDQIFNQQPQPQR